MKLNQRGMEMPIQIFIVLFVLLAVGMLVLQMFQQQIGNSAEQLQAQTNQRQMQAEMLSKQQFCQSRCGCDALEKKAEFCFSKLDGGVNFDGKGMPTDFYEKGGIGLCEDSVYCSHLTDCKCDLTIANCVTVLCSYWQTQGLGNETMNNKLREFYKPGNCAFSDEKKSSFWYYINEPRLKC